MKTKNLLKIESEVKEWNGQGDYPEGFYENREWIIEDLVRHNEHEAVRKILLRSDISLSEEFKSKLIDAAYQLLDLACELDSEEQKDGFVKTVRLLYEAGAKPSEYAKAVYPKAFEQAFKDELDSFKGVLNSEDNAQKKAIHQEILRYREKQQESIWWGLREVFAVGVMVSTIQDFFYSRLIDSKAKETIEKEIIPRLQNDFNSSPLSVLPPTLGITGQDITVGPRAVSTDKGEVRSNDAHSAARMMSLEHTDSRDKRTFLSRFFSSKKTTNGRDVGGDL